MVDIDNYTQGAKTFRSTETDGVHTPHVINEPSLSDVPSLTGAAITFATSGDHTVIAAVALQTARVHRLYLTAAAATTITFKRGATALTGAISLPNAGDGIFLDFSAEPWFTTDVNEAFIINSSAAVQVSGRVEYKQSV